MPDPRPEPKPAPPCPICTQYGADSECRVCEEIAQHKDTPGFDYVLDQDFVTHVGERTDTPEAYEELSNASTMLEFGHLVPEKPVL